jgi:LCCL domain
MKKIIFLLIISVATVFAKTEAQPAWSRGIQTISLNEATSLLRAEAALKAEGYTIQKSGSDFIEGQKGIHTALIACNASSDGNTYVNIFVASNAIEEGIPGAERQRLQNRMEHTSPTKVIQASWSTRPNSLGGRPSQRFTIYLPPGGVASGAIWGSDVYTDDSSIGTAAVHAGLISFENGGTVTIEIRPGQAQYKSTTRYGITSASYGYWGGSFVFVR